LINISNETPERIIDVDNERRIYVSELTTRPSSNGETPLPRRVPRGLLPSTWTERTLAPVFGVDRRAIARHDRSCLTDERREQVLTGLKGGGG
jgi:hypothetical protein